MFYQKFAAAFEASVPNERCADGPRGAIHMPLLYRDVRMAGQRGALYLSGSDVMIASMRSSTFKLISRASGAMVTGLMGLLMGLLVGLLVLACSSAEKRERDSNRRTIRKLIPYSLHYRRTPFIGADPAVGPGGIDYQTNPRPGARFDCEPMKSLFKEIDLISLRRCLGTLKSDLVVLYRLKRDPAPFLVLDENPEMKPDCLRTALANIPVPREIFFQSNEEGVMSCYSSRLDIEADELFWVKVPKAKTALRLDFPLASPPETDEQTHLLLMSWAMAPFWRDPGHHLISHLVPDALCRACLGKENMLENSGPPVLLWP